MGVYYETLSSRYEAAVTPSLTVMIEKCAYLKKWKALLRTNEGY